MIMEFMTNPDPKLTAMGHPNVSSTDHAAAAAAAAAGHPTTLEISRHFK